MRVLLVVPRYSYTRAPDPTYLFPLGLAYVSAAMKAAGHAVTCLNLNHRHGATRALVARALDAGPFDAVCTGHLAVGVEAVRKIVAAARRHPSRPRVILGGMIVTSAPETMVRFLRPDVAVLGEAEETIVELLAAMERGRDLAAVPGLAFPDGAGVRFTAPRPPPGDLDALPWPDFEGLELGTQLDGAPSNVQSEYMFESDHPRFYPLIASRGCPHDCTFCYHSGRYRARSVEGVLAELRANVPRFDVNALFVYDEVLAADRARLDAFCAGIRGLSRDLGRELRWICQLSVRSVDEAVIRTLRESGCYSICFGFESMSPKVLESMRKPITPEQIARAFRLTKEARLALQAIFIFGDPAETPETARETLGWWKAHAQGQVGLGFVQPYPGSAIWRRCRERGLIRDELAFIRGRMATGHTGVYLNMTELSDGAFRALRRDVAVAWSAHNAFVRPTALHREPGGRYALDLRCPFCAEDSTYRNLAIPSPSMMTIWMNCRRCNMRFKLVGPAGLVAKKLLPPGPRFAVEALYNRSVILRKQLV